MDLVGAEPVKKVKPAPAEKGEKTPPVPKIVEAVISEAQQQELPVPQEEAVQEPSQKETSQKQTSQKQPPQEEVREEPAEERAPVPAAEEKEPAHKPRITAIVCELVNQELGSVAERFRLSLTDANLWALTRAALEEVRPEFSADSEETKEKLERLRPRVIGAMTKVAIKIAAKDRNS
ncbi:MAG: hypothetical protein J1F60_03210 [Oscillospiraceae bacterium]|nr:hypothetical protein [Oscillospiraceae bacterium]